MKKYYEYFMGNKVSEEGLKYGYVDYACLAKCFDAVLNNDIISKTSDIGFWDTISGSEYDEETDEYTDIFQYYIVSSNAVDLLKEGGEIVFYNDELDMYVWGVTHWGTSWEYVLTNIKLREKEEELLKIWQRGCIKIGQKLLTVLTGV